MITTEDIYAAYYVSYQGIAISEEQATRLLNGMPYKQRKAWDAMTTRVNAIRPDSSKNLQANIDLLNKENDALDTANNQLTHKYNVLKNGYAELEEGYAEVSAQRDRIKLQHESVLEVNQQLKDSLESLQRRYKELEDQLGNVVVGHSEGSPSDRSPSDRLRNIANGITSDHSKPMKAISLNIKAQALMLDYFSEFSDGKDPA